MIDDIRKNLQNHQPVSLSSQHDDRSRAAVLVPLVIDKASPRLLLTERAGVMNSHGGEVAFPGGKEDDTDHSLEFTALRENEEELGIKPGDVDVIGSLRPFVSKYGLVVTPYVGVVSPTVSLQPNPDEIASVFQVPLSFFMTAPPIRFDEISRHGETHRIAAWDFDGYEIWGLTAMIVDEFLKVGLK